MAIDLRLRYLQTNFTDKIIYLEDFTGINSGADTTVGGYGLTAQSDNPSKLEADQEINSWTLTVTRPDTTTFVVPINNLQFDNLQEVIQIPIVESQATLQSGLWTFKLDINEDSGILDTITITQYIYDIEELRKKINSKFIEKVDYCKINCECNKGLITLWSYYKALEAAIEQENNIQIEYLITQINLLV